MSGGKETIPKATPSVPSIYHGVPLFYRFQTCTTTEDKQEAQKFFTNMAWELYESGEYADLTIRVKGSAREFRVHKAVVCKQSKYFEAACRGKFIEAANHCIELSDEDPEIVELMVKYLYSHCYENDEDYETTLPPKPILTDSKAGIGNGTGAEERNDTIPNCVRVFAIADKLLIPHLRDLAKARFADWAEQHWWSTRFLLTAREIFDNKTGNYADLRRIVLDVLGRHAEQLFCVSRVAAVRECDGANHPDDNPQVSARGSFTLADLLHEFPCLSVCLLSRVLDNRRVCIRRLEADKAELQSEVKSLFEENKKILPLQLKNQGLNKTVNELRAQLSQYRLQESHIMRPSPLAVEFGELPTDYFEDDGDGDGDALGHAHPLLPRDDSIGIAINGDRNDGDEHGHAQVQDLQD